MKNSLRTKIALVSLVFVSSIAYAKKNNQSNKAIFTASNAAAVTADTTGATKPNTAASFNTGKFTDVNGPAQVKGNLFVNGRLYGKFFPVGTYAGSDATNKDYISDDIDRAYVSAHGAADTNSKTTIPLSGPLAADDIVAREVTVKNLKIDGNLAFGTKRFVGQFNNWDPAQHNIIISFAGGAASGKPARVNWAFMTTTTWAGTVDTRNEAVSVFATNGGIPDLISPFRPGRSFVSNNDMLYTNTVYMWTSKNETGLNIGRAAGQSAAQALLPSSWRLTNNPRFSAYNATTNQDMTLTSSVRNVYSDGGQTAANIVANKMGWGLTARGISNFHTATAAAGVQSAKNPGYFAANSPFSSITAATSGVAPYADNTANCTGVLFYEIIGDNVTDIALGYTWDRSATLVSVLSGFTTAQLNTLLATLTALLGINARGPQPASRDAIIELLSKHGELLKKTGILSRMMNA